MFKFICQKGEHGISEGIPEHQKRPLSIRVDRLDPVLLHVFHIVHICIDRNLVVINIILLLYSHGIKHLCQISGVFLPNLIRRISRSIVFPAKPIHKLSACQQRALVIPMGVPFQIQAFLRSFKCLIQIHIVNPCLFQKRCDTGMVIFPAPPVSRRHIAVIKGIFIGSNGKDKSASPFLNMLLHQTEIADCIQKPLFRHLVLSQIIIQCPCIIEPAVLSHQHLVRC